MNDHVVVSYYHPPNRKLPVVHVYGPVTTKTKANSRRLRYIRGIKRRAGLDFPADTLDYLTHHTCKVLVHPLTGEELV